MTKNIIRSKQVTENITDYEKRIYNMKLLNDNNKKIKILTKNKLVKKTKYYKIKNGEKRINTFYMAYIPPYVVDYLEIKDNTIYFYENNNNICISGNKPSENHKKIKIQKGNQFSIPRMFFHDLENYNSVIIVCHLSEHDKYNNDLLGLFTIELN